MDCILQWIIEIANGSRTLPYASSTAPIDQLKKIFLVQKILFIAYSTTQLTCELKPTRIQEINNQNQFANTIFRLPTLKVFKLTLQNIVSTISFSCFYSCLLSPVYLNKLLVYCRHRISQMLSFLLVPDQLFRLPRYLPKNWNLKK